MKYSVAGTVAILLFCLTFAEGFPSLSGSFSGAVARPFPAGDAAKQKSTKTVLSSVGRSSDEGRKLPKAVYKLNSSTKWLVTAANTLGIWTRLPHYEAPFIVVGAIVATFFTDALKQVINHDRPTGAPFTDPGMPSSHSLVSFFLAAAWGSMVCTGVGVPLVWAGASAVALLRVICGYHSWDQIGVGAAMGSSMGFAWVRLGIPVYQAYPRTMRQASWGFYVAGSILYILTKMRDWIHKDKHL